VLLFAVSIKAEAGCRSYESPSGIRALPRTGELRPCAGKAALLALIAQ
jgi:hypothetical protein